MKKYTAISLVILIFVLIQCSSESDTKNYQKFKILNSKADLQIGKMLLTKDITTFSSSHLLVSSSQSYPYIERKFDGINYSIAYDDKTKIIKYISTNDSIFRTSEGYKVGTKLDEFDKELLSTLIHETGWASYIKLPSGWNAGFPLDSSMSERKLKKHTEVKWFFKR